MGSSSDGRQGRRVTVSTAPHFLYGGVYGSKNNALADQQIHCFSSLPRGTKQQHLQAVM